MSSIGTGYDLSCTTFSPEGRVFQVEYAVKAVENSGTAIGICTKNGIALAVEKLILSKMLVPGSNNRIQTVNPHCGMAFSGLLADARQLVNRARQESETYKSNFGAEAPVKYLNERISQYMQAHTLFASMRPFGVSCILGGYDKKGFQLTMIDPSGVSFGYSATAIGKGHTTAKTELEKLKLDDMSATDAVKAAAKIIFAVHDDIKDKEFEVELSWCCEESDFKHTKVPKELYEQAVTEAKKSTEEDDDDDDMEEDV